MSSVAPEDYSVASQDARCRPRSLVSLPRLRVKVKPQDCEVAPKTTAAASKDQGTAPRRGPKVAPSTSSVTPRRECRLKDVCSCRAQDHEASQRS
ncbi:hypothetical protein Nepgr_033998 [Nepenthes gracilis]|uniref:Uncharacterized protein n=1 Tax=Nepenthes gracilis TaxID=150966 RepID=A0AAD3TMR8_NEPGR|nr:hypothetical protein Nepgr_033998 [Nepenthes gracilis]